MDNDGESKVRITLENEPNAKLRIIGTNASSAFDFNTQFSFCILY